MVSGRKLIINWLIKSKAIKDNERELYEYALYSIVLLLSPAFISIAIGCIMGIPILNHCIGSILRIQPMSRFPCIRNTIAISIS